MKRLVPILLALVFSVLCVAPSFAQSPVSICVLKDRNQGGATIQDCVPVGTGSGYVSLPISSSASSPEFVQGLGAAGAPLGGVLSVQGVSGGVAVPTTPGQTKSTTTMATAAPTAATFGTLLASNVARNACLIQNTGTTTGYVYFGANGSATTANSFVVAAGQSISCTNNNITLTDNVAGTCASGTCAFVISSQ